MKLQDRLNNYTQQHGVYLVQKPREQLYDSYLEIRKKENRILDDETVKSLPYVQKTNPFYSEWLKRMDTVQRFENYLEQHAFTSCLEIGCGNGWFSNLIATKNIDTLGIDTNLPELEQAARVFDRPNVYFAYVDDLFTFLVDQSFDLIVFNASIQYFQHLDQFFQKLQEALHPNGEIHILDSPVYKNEQERSAAKQRSDAYYEKMGVPEMSEKYFHHSFSNFSGFQKMYTPPTNVLLKRFRKQHSPFPWLVFKPGK